MLAYKSVSCGLPKTGGTFLGWVMIRQFVLVMGSLMDSLKGMILKSLLCLTVVLSFLHQKGVEMSASDYFTFVTSTTSDTSCHQQLD